jgi:hypothetical protein
MTIRNETRLRTYRAGRHCVRLWAVLDELTQTYDVVQRDSQGRERALKHHVLSLRAARRWASAFDDPVAAHGRPC